MAANNFYSAAKNNPEVMEKRQQRIAHLDAEMKRMQTTNAGRRPGWDDERIMLLDRAALELGKRCIMWDDQGSGFFLMLNWDWVDNRPAVPPTPEAAFDPGWWVNARQLLQLPLIDPTIPENKLAAWLDNHSMNVHHRLLAKRDKICPGSAHAAATTQQQNPAFILEDEYWNQLQALPRES